VEATWFTTAALYTPPPIPEMVTKESFESNIPGLVERAKEERSQGNNAMRGSYYDINSIEDELLDVEDEINSIYGKW